MTTAECNAWGASERRRQGRIEPASRPYPRRIECSTFARVPDRLLRSGASPVARLLGARLCRVCPEGAHACGASNQQLAAQERISARAVQRALIDLEDHRFIWRLEAGDEIGLDSLLLAGYRDPWADAPPAARPSRAIVLLWRLPEPHTLGQGARRARRAQGLP